MQQRMRLHRVILTGCVSLGTFEGSVCEAVAARRAHLPESASATAMCSRMQEQTTARSTYLPRQLLVHPAITEQSSGLGDIDSMSCLGMRFGSHRSNLGKHAALRLELVWMDVLLHLTVSPFTISSQRGKPPCLASAWQLSCVPSWQARQTSGQCQAGRAAWP